MSDIVKSAVDLDALPTALKAMAKSHLRVDGSYDDDYITLTLKRAIAWFERVTGVSLNPVTWEWSPASVDFCNGAAPVPVSPVNDLTVVDGAAVDISANYTLTTMSTHGVGLYALNGAFVADMVVTISSGYADLVELDPGIVDAVLRFTAHVYENREIVASGPVTLLPDWETEITATYWMPRA